VVLGSRRCSKGVDKHSYLKDRDYEPSIRKPLLRNNVGLDYVLAIANDVQVFPPINPENKLP
jgi:hypothetical protein